uniref:Uncharacterized protein n=1 Tax=Oryza nivara TaxID=4536 RepID=A0A0E0G435_ORYNI
MEEERENNKMKMEEGGRHHRPSLEVSSCGGLGVECGSLGAVASPKSLQRVTWESSSTTSEGRSQSITGWMSTSARACRCCVNPSRSRRECGGFMHLSTRAHNRSTQQPPPGRSIHPSAAPAAAVSANGMCTQGQSTPNVWFFFRLINTSSCIHMQKDPYYTLLLALHLYLQVKVYTLPPSLNILCFSNHFSY